MKLLHTYQNTLNGSLLFYDTIDFLVCFTIICTEARKYGIRMLGFCPMYDHIHNLFCADSRKDISLLVGSYTRKYSLALNNSIDSTGQVFNHGFGCALKNGDKSVRTACSYLYNNPGEKGLCKRAEDYRWTFLAFAASRNPFSEKLLLNKASMDLRRALKEISSMREQDKSLYHSMLQRLFTPLCGKEKSQLTDYIISRYNCIDYETLISLYVDYDTMCLAFASNQGKEYDIKETFEPGNHRIYQAISASLINDFGFKNVKDALRLPLSEQEELMHQLYYATGAKDWQLRKYFRWQAR